MNYARPIHAGGHEQMPASTRTVVPDNRDRAAVIKRRFEALCASVHDQRTPLSVAWNKTMPLLILADDWTRRKNYGGPHVQLQSGSILDLS